MFVPRFKSCTTIAPFRIDLFSKNHCNLFIHSFFFFTTNNLFFRTLVQSQQMSCPALSPLSSFQNDPLEHKSMYIVCNCRTR